MNWSENALVEAKEFLVDYLADEICDQILSVGEASTDIFNDYAHGDSAFHESIVDREYSLADAAELLEELWQHEETDSGLWAGLPPREAICVQAAYTYGNAVMRDLVDLIEEINFFDFEEEEEEEKKERKIREVIKDITRTSDEG